MVILWPLFIVKHNRSTVYLFNNKFIEMHIYTVYIIRISVLPKGRSFTANSGAMAAVLLKGRSSTANSGTQAAVLLGMDRCGSFPLLSAPHSFFSIWTDDPRGTSVGMRVDLANWALRTSPKFTTRIKYFHQSFWPNQRSGNPITFGPHIYFSDLKTFKSYLIFTVSV